jgi:hypothetical protein
MTAEGAVHEEQHADHHSIRNKPNLPPKQFRSRISGTQLIREQNHREKLGRTTNDRIE